MSRMTMNSGMFFGARILAVIVFIGLGSQSFAQNKPPLPLPVDPEPNSSSASFGDWALRCQRLGNGAETQRVCEVAEQIRGQDQQNPVAELAIGRLKKTDPLRLTVILPVNVTFSNPPTFSADGKVAEPLDLGWRKCLPGGCIADALLKEDVLRRWKTQTSAGRITWTDATGRELAVALSSRGLTRHSMPWARNRKTDLQTKR